jgi:hypothetical protein
MSRNYGFAFSHIKDGWITYLGDDDGFLPNALALEQTASFVKQDAKRCRRNGIITLGRALTELFRRIG